MMTIDVLRFFRHVGYRPSAAAGPTWMWKRRSVVVNGTWTCELEAVATCAVTQTEQ